MKPGRIDFRPKPEEGSLGRMFANRDLRLALFAAAEGNEAIAWHARAEVVERTRGAHGVSVTLGSGQVLRASLMVAAEGRQSPTRDEAGFSMAKWDYSHCAIVTALTHETPHEGVAWEIFYPAGPFALLPLRDLPDGRHRSALVWTVAEKDAPGVLKMPNSMFLAEVHRNMHGVFGKLELAAPRMSYPLKFHHSRKLSEDRLALVGDAAHGMHPIAGQGLNLGLRDVGALVEVLSDGMRLGLEPGDAQLLARYEKWRSLDAFMVMSVTDGLTRLFGIPGKLPSAARRLGMGAVQRLPALKRFFMDEARGMSASCLNCSGISRYSSRASGAVPRPCQRAWLMNSNCLRYPANGPVRASPWLLSGRARSALRHSALHRRSTCLPLRRRAGVAPAPQPRRSGPCAASPARAFDRCLRADHLAWFAPHREQAGNVAERAVEKTQIGCYHGQLGRQCLKPRGKLVGGDGGARERDDGSYRARLSIGEAQAELGSAR